MFESSARHLGRVISDEITASLDSLLQHGLAYVPPLSKITLSLRRRVAANTWQRLSREISSDNRSFSVCVAALSFSPFLFFPFSFSFSLFLAPSFVIDTRAKRISIRPLDDAIYLQLVPRPPTDAPRSNKESRNPLSSLSPLPPPSASFIHRSLRKSSEFFPLHLRSFFVRANFTSHSCEVVHPSTELQLSFAFGKKIFEKDSGLIRERKEERNSYLGYRVA